MTSRMTGRGCGLQPSRPAAPLFARVVGVTGSADIASLNLDGRVVNIEIMMKTLGCLVQKFVTAAIRHNQVSGKDVFGGACRPDMEIVDTFHSR